ncbi:hypothetical protein BH09ACT6_BH09ACT6_00330 [soil metagenome]
MSAKIPRTTSWVLRWASLYTRGLPTEIAHARRDELVSDLYEHRAAAGTSNREQGKVAREIMFRAVFGIGSDLSWRKRQLHHENTDPAAGLPESSTVAQIQSGQSGHAVRGCTAGSQALLEILNEVLVAAQSTEMLLAAVDRDGRPASEDARLGLHLRFTFVSLQHSLADLKCCSDHAAIQDEAATLLIFYLHMITRSFEVRFSTLAREQYAVLAHDPEKQTTHSKLLRLRNTLQDSLNGIAA